MALIHIVLGKANPNRMNGVNKVVYQLASKQALNGKDVQVWGISKSLEHNYDERPFQTRIFPASTNPFGIDSSLNKAIHGLNSKLDRVHLHGSWIPCFPAISKALAEKNIPFLLTPHGGYNAVARKKGWLKKQLFYPLFERQVLNRATMIHAIGSSEIDGLSDLHKSSKHCLIPYGFETTESSHRPQVKPGFVVGFMGRLDYHTKGLDLLLNAFAEVAQGRPNIKLWILGDGPARSQMEKEILALGIGKQVKFWGAVYRQEKMELLQQMNVFAHPSRNEGLPSSVLEAASLGIPVIVSKATNMAEIVFEYGAGRVVANEDAVALAEALAHSYQDFKSKTLHRQGEAAQAMVQYAFNWDAILKQFDQCYESLQAAN